MKKLKKFGIGAVYGFLITALILQIANIIKALSDFSNVSGYLLPSAVISLLSYMYLLNNFWNKNKPKDKWTLRSLIDKEIKKNGLNCDLNHINVKNVRDMSDLFSGSQFNGDISKWDTSNVVNMSSMFWESKFNGDISKWNTSKVINMSFMFYGSEFNGDISKWNVSRLLTMSQMFSRSKFNGDISQWDVSRVINMQFMFCDSEFKCDLSNWNVINLVDVELIFYDSKFKWYPNEDENESLLPLPYWANYGNKMERDNAVKEYLKIN